MWMLAPTEMLADAVTAPPLFDTEYNFATGDSSYHHRNRPSDQYLWDAGDLASLRQEREQLEAVREIYVAANGMGPTLAEFEDSDVDWVDRFADSVPVTTAVAPLLGPQRENDLDQVTSGEMLNLNSYNDNLAGGDSSASVNGMDSDEDYDSDMHSHLAFGMECETPTSSTSSVDFESAPETRRLSLEIPIDHIEAEIMSNSAGSDANYMSDSSPISVHDSEVQPSTPVSDATDDSEWLPTESSSTTSESDMDYTSDTDESTTSDTSEATDDSQWATTASSATTPGSDMSHASDTDENLLTFDDMTNTVDAIYALVGADSYAREAFLTYAYILVSHVNEEFDNVQIDYLATHLQNFRDHHQGDNPILFFADLCRVLGLLGEDGRIPPNVFGP